MGDETIDVLCMCLPDGTNYWFEAAEDFEETVAHARKVMEVWKQLLSQDQRDRFERCNAMGGFVWLHMPREEYRNIPATNQSAALAAAAGVLT